MLYKGSSSPPTEKRRGTMKKNCVVGFLIAILVAACGPKPNTTQPANPPLAVAAAEIPSNAPRPQPASASPTNAAPQSSTPPITTNATIPEDPNDLAEIQKLFLQTVNEGVRKAEAGLKTPVTRIQGNETRTFFAEYTGKFTYDIKKTDSIVSPLLGTVSWTVNWYENGILTNIPTTLDARYAYQNGRWVIRDLVRRVNDEKNYPADEYLPLFQ